MHHRKIFDFPYSLGMEYVSEEDYHQELFNKKYPEIWNEYKNKYETLNCGYYPIKGVLGKMKRIDLQFANSHEDGVSHVFYNSDW